MRIASLVLYPDSSCGFCAAEHNNLKLARFGSPPRFGAAGRRPHLRARERPQGKPNAGIVSERGCVKSRPRSTSAHARARRQGLFTVGAPCPRALQLSRADRGPQQGLKLMAGHVARRGRPTQGPAGGLHTLACGSVTSLRRRHVGFHGLCLMHLEVFYAP